MSPTTLFMIAVGLSMDAFAVSVTDGMVNRRLDWGKTLFIALTFGLMQGLMPTAGYLAGSAFSAAIRSLDHWIALGLLGFTGARMIRGALNARGKGEEDIPELFSFRLVAAQGVATSIDALAMGVSFAVMEVDILPAAAFIACVTCALSAAGVRIGRRCGGLLRNKAQIFGGCVLILIGIHIFLEHTCG